MSENLKSAVTFLSEETGIPEYRITSDDKAEYVVKSKAVSVMIKFAENAVKEFAERITFKEDPSWNRDVDEIRDQLISEIKEI